MANIKSQIKRNRQNERARLRNKAVRSELRTRVKSAISAATSAGAASGKAAKGATEESEAALRLAVKRLDKAAAKGIIHKNQAANRKSRLVRRINALKASS